MYKEPATMSQWCVESYPSSLYKFEIFSKLMFLAFWRNSGRDQGGPNPCLVHVTGYPITRPTRVHDDTRASVHPCIHIHTASSYLLFMSYYYLFSLAFIYMTYDILHVTLHTTRGVHGTRYMYTVHAVIYACPEL